MRLLAATCFGNFRPSPTLEMWQTMVAEDGVVLACDGPDVVGMALYLDLWLTVPGGEILPAAGLSWVAVAPTHRRRGVLRGMFVDVHRRIGAAGYPLAALLASEGGIYGRFGYGPATVEQRRSVLRREAIFHPDVPDPGGVRIVAAARHAAQLADIYERWRRCTPGGLFTPEAMWNEVLADREEARDGGSALFCLLHDDGFALYRVRGEERASVEVTKLTAVTVEAHIALWRALLGLDLMQTVSVTTHPADPLPYLLTNPRVVRTTGSEDALWLRITDIPRALEARRYGADLDVVLDVSDAFLDHGGRYQLTIRNGRARCTPTDAAPDVHTDLGVLGSLYFGGHRPAVFAHARRLRCADPTLVPRLETAFASEVPAELGYGF